MKSCIAYPNLRAEMARKGIRIIDISKLLGKQRSTMSLKLSLKNELLLSEAIMIRDNFFPEFEIDYLFAKNNFAIARLMQQRKDETFVPEDSQKQYTV